MNNNKLPQAQYDIQRQQRKDLLATDNWLKSKGLNTCTLTKIPTKLLQAQNKAHTLLTQHSNLLTKEQIKTLRNFIANEMLEHLQVDDISCFSIDGSVHPCFEHIVVPVEVAVAALSKDFKILFVAPTLVIQTMCSIKCFSPTDFHNAKMIRCVDNDRAG